MAFTLIVNNTFAQEKGISLILKGGPSKYDITIAGLSGHTKLWGGGFQISSSIEKPLNRVLSLEGRIVYSKYNYVSDLIDASNNIFDIISSLKLDLGNYCYFLAGLGVGYESRDEIRIPNDAKYYNSGEIVYNADNILRAVGVIGVGIDVKAIEQFNIIIEADLNFRNYAGVTLLMGVKYTL